MVLDGIISTIVGDHLDIAPTQAIGVVNSPNSVNPKTLSHGNTEPSMSRWLKACVENLQGASQADEDKFRPLWKHSESHRNDAVTQKCGVTYAIIGFALMVGFIASMNTSGMTAMDILVLGFIPTLFLIAILYGRIVPLYRAIDKVQMPNSVNPKLFEQGNTELNPQQCGKCVQTIEHLTLWVKDIVGTYGKPYESTRNELASCH